MRINTANQLRKEITALDLALKMLRAETEGLRRSTVTLKKATNAPLALWEEHWFGELPQAEQDNINRTARMIGNALATRMNPAPAVNNTITSATPAKPANKKPAKRTRTIIETEKRNKPWSKTDDKNLMRMVRAKETPQHMASVLGRSVGAITQRITILKKGK
jgi:hypothetical protein